MKGRWISFVLFLGSCVSVHRSDFTLGSYGEFPFRTLYGIEGEPKDYSIRFQSRLTDDFLDIYKHELEMINPDEDFDSAKALKRMKKTFGQKNETVFALLAAEINRDLPNHNLSFEDISELRGETLSNLVTGSGAESKYRAYSMGYCFGRATFVHLKLSKMGIRQRNMAKIFVLGHLLNSDQIWKFHMATLVKGLSHGKPVWWVIDTLVDRVMQLEDWGKRISKLSIVEGGSDLRFYVSEPEKFLPSFGEYSLSQLQLQEYHGYFDDLGRMLLAQ